MILVHLPQSCPDGATSTLRHPNIVLFMGLVQQGDELYLVEGTSTLSLFISHLPIPAQNISTVAPFGIY
jgi:hypothetical protein